MKGLALAGFVMMSTAAVAQIHTDCHTENLDSRIFAVAYAGAIIDLKRDDKANYQMPAINYVEAFEEVCKVVDQHPGLWDRPSREAVTFAVDKLWKKPSR
jgi:hypothetical protein